MHKSPASYRTVLIALTAATLTVGSSATARNDGAAWLDAAGGQNIKIWTPVPVPGESVRWAGSAESATGPGLAVWTVGADDTEQAAGEWKDGKLNGYAVWQHLDGTRYEGQWQDGLRHGFGIYTWPNGIRFCGEYEQGHRKTGVYYKADGKLQDPSTPISELRKQIFESETAAMKARQAASRVRRQSR
ncbi:MAG TPA: hypothetical protein DCS43_01050 [Verrucomicrobia bacterium]|nr:hypothetical protein [Verrucomicrobiota bacterium]